MVLSSQPCLKWWNAVPISFSIVSYERFGAQKVQKGFPGGSVVKNLLANAEATGSIPGSLKIPHAVQQLSLCHNY